MVAQDFNREAGTLKLGSPEFKSLHDCTEFFVVDLVIALGRVVLAGIVGD